MGTRDSFTSLLERLRDIAATPPLAHTGYVYLARLGRDGAVKIGWSIDPVERLASLQTASPERLHLLLAIKARRPDERRIHLELRDHRIGGEWFEPHPDVPRDIIRLIRSGKLLCFRRQTKANSLPSSEASARRALIAQAHERSMGLFRSGTFDRTELGPFVCCKCHASHTVPARRCSSCGGHYAIVYRDEPVAPDVFGDRPKKASS